jgi:hypothetical protein
VSKFKNTTAAKGKLSETIANHSASPVEERKIKATLSAHV